MIYCQYCGGISGFTHSCYEKEKVMKEKALSDKGMNRRPKPGPGEYIDFCTDNIKKYKKDEAHNK